MNIFSAYPFRHLISVVGGSLLLVFFYSSSALADSLAPNNLCAKAEAPRSIAGMDVNFQIENTITNLSSGFLSQGVAVVHYKKDGTWTVEGTGGENQQAYYGTYRYQRTGFNTAVEKGIDVSLNNAPLSTTYTFETATSGKWVQDYGRGTIIFSGSFTMVPSNLPNDQHLAPTTNVGLNVALIIKDSSSATLPANVYPHKGLALQTYLADSTFSIVSFGPNTLNSHGTYSFTKVSANTAVEEAVQDAGIFVLPYTMVYTFETPTSGRWFQNLGNGFIKFTGTFDTFPQ